MDRDIRPDDLCGPWRRRPAQTPIGWRAKAALITAADAWESSEGALMDDFDYATHCGD